LFGVAVVVVDAWVVEGVEVDEVESSPPQPAATTTITPQVAIEVRLIS
jgi:hypothetical protein